MATDNQGYSAPRHRRPQGQPAPRMQTNGPARAYRAPQVQAQRIAARIPPISDEQSAPRPIGVDPAATGSFQRITADQGARVENRESTARATPDTTGAWAPLGYGAEMRLQGKRRPTVRSRERKIKSSRNLFVALGIAAALVVMVAAFAAHAIYRSYEVDPTQQEQPIQSQVAIDQQLTVNEATYALQQRDDGTYALVRLESDGTVTELAACTGQPVQLMFSNGALLVPENLSEGWDVIAYTVGASSVGTQVVNSSGDPVIGKGTIESVSLGENSLIIDDSEGTTTTIAL